MRLKSSSILVFLIVVVALAACAAEAPAASPTIASTEVAGSTEAAALPASDTSTATPFAAQAIEDRAGCVISAPPAELGLDPYYTKYCDANGIIIAASGEVDDFAMREAWYLVVNFFAPLPEALASLVESGAQLSIYDSRLEDLRDIPEHYTLSFDTTNFAIGLGGTLSNPVTVTLENDLLCNSNTNYRVTIHELGHMLRDMYLLPERRGFLREGQNAFANAFAAGLWEGAYARENADENWAEGVGAYFGVYRDSNGTRYVSDRSSLENYDAMLFELIDSVFMGFEWEPSCPPLRISN
jgi:hypothetical protein